MAPLKMGYEAVQEARQQAKAEFADLRASMIQRAIAAAKARTELVSGAGS